MSIPLSAGINEMVQMIPIVLHSCNERTQKIRPFRKKEDFLLDPDLLEK